MQTSEQLTQYGKRITERLNKIGKDREWLIRMMYESRNPITMEELELLLTDDRASRKRQEIVGRVVFEEEQRQRLKQTARIKR